MAALAAGQVTRRPTAHASTEQNYVLVFNSADCCQIVIYWVGVFFHLLLIRSAPFVQSVARILDSEYVHFHVLSEHIEQVECKTDVFGITMEVNYNFGATVFTRQVQGWNVLKIFVSLLSYLFRNLYLLLSRFWWPSLRWHRTVLLKFFIVVFGLEWACWFQLWF